MTTPRQYVACAFTEGGRTYTYHFDGEQPLVAGDRVLVDRKHGEAKVIVVELVDTAPSFATKPIKGRAPAEPEAVS